MYTGAGIHQNGVLGARLEGGNIRKADGFIAGLAVQRAGGKDGHRHAAHPHRHLGALGAVRQRGGHGAAALAHGGHNALFVHLGHRGIAALPEQLLAAILLGGLVGDKAGGILFLAQPKLIFVGIVGEAGGLLALGVLDAGEGQGLHHKINVHRLALHAVICAGGSVAALPHFVGAGVAQPGGKAGDPQFVPPLVKGRIVKPGAHPVQRGVQPLPSLIAVAFQLIEEGSHQRRHLVGQKTGNTLVLQIVVDREFQLIGRSGVVLQPLMGGRRQAQQAGHMVGLPPGVLLGDGVGVQVAPEGDAQPGTFVRVAPPLGVVLVVVPLAVPLVAESAAQNGKVDAGGLGFLPVHLALVFGHINALEHRAGNDLARVIEIKALVIFLPRAGGLAKIRFGGRFRPGVAAHKPHHQTDNQRKAGQPGQRQQLAALVCGRRFGGAALGRWSLRLFFRRPVGRAAFGHGGSPFSQVLLECMRSDT